LSVQTFASGRYRIGDVLGRGGMATVYVAQDEELERPVAIKVLAGHLADDPSFRDRFVREARLAAQLSHPNVVQIFDAGEDDGTPFIVMEYVDGHTLSGELDEVSRLDPERVVDLGVQVCAGLEHAHAAGLVHRDIKPGNLLLRGDDGTVKIADFGIARAAEATRLTQMGSVLGTAAYLAPEQALGEEVTASADIYSFGCVLYECLTGRTPYMFDTLAELAFKHQSEPICPVREIREEVPAELEAVVMRCLARNPDYRPPSAAVIAEELQVASPEELGSASPEDSTRPLPQASGVRASEVHTVPLRRPTTPAPRRSAGAPFGRGALLAVVAALLVVAAIVIAVTVNTGNDNGPPGGNPAPTRVEPVPQTGDPANDARDLSNWLRSNSG
jgi:eukaryotic-like serine/threonine-protein kinase